MQKTDDKADPPTCKLGPSDLVDFNLLICDLGPSDLVVSNLLICGLGRTS